MPRPMKTFSVSDADKRTVLTQAGWVRQGEPSSEWAAVRDYLATGPEGRAEQARRPERWIAPAAGSAPVSLRTAWAIHQGRER